MVTEEEKDAGWGVCKMPFWQNTNSGGVGGGGSASSSSSSCRGWDPNQQKQQQKWSSGSSVSSLAMSLLPTKRRLRLDPPTKLYFPYEPGKQVRSAIRIKNTSQAHVAFKFQTTAPKSCFMRPPGGTLAPGETVIATVFKFVETPEDNDNQSYQKCKCEVQDYEPESKLLSGFDEQKDRVSVEQILRVVFLDVERPCPQMEKLKLQLAEAEAAAEARKQPPENAGPKIAEGLVIDEWKERRERYLARQQAQGDGSS